MTTPGGHREIRVGAVKKRVTEDDLRSLVAQTGSWRGVLRSIGLRGTGVASKLRAQADEWGIDYSHFGGHDEPRLRQVVEASATWTEAMLGLGYSEHSGSARATIRRRARKAGVRTEHLDSPSPSHGLPLDSIFDAVRPNAEHLRRAAGYMVAAACEMHGYSVSWPLEPMVYDLVVDLGPLGLRRVQVKTATSKQEGCWQAWITKAGRVPYTREEIDYFAVVDGDHDIYMIPITEVEGQTGLRLRHYAQYRLSQRR